MDDSKDIGEERLGPSDSEWSSSDYEREAEADSVRHFLSGAEHPHPRDLNWNMTYFNERGIDVTDGMFPWGNRCGPAAARTMPGICLAVLRLRC